MLKRLLVAALAAAVLSAAPADAQSGTQAGSGRGLQLSVRRAVNDDGSFLSRLRYSVPAGGQVEEQIIVQNITMEPADYAVYVGDLNPDGHGGADGTLLGDKPVAMGTWLSVSHDKLQLGPKGKQVVTLRMKVPADAAAGDHAGYLFIQRIPRAGSSEELQSSEGKAAAALVIATRLAIPITERVPGELKRDLQLLDPVKKYEEEDLRIEYGLQNPGNLLEFPDGSWTLKDPSGAVLFQEEAVNWGLVAPGGKLVRNLVLPADRPLVRGEYTMSVDVDYGPPEDRRELVKEWKLTLP